MICPFEDCEPARQATALEYLEVLLGYIAAANDVVTETEIQRVIEAALPRTEEILMPTLAEKWVEQGREEGRAAVLTISPLAHNWAVRFCSHAIYSDLNAFENAVRSGEVLRTVEHVLTSRKARSPQN